MILTFKETDPAKVRDQIVAAIGGRKLSKLVNFELKNNQLVVVISKLGTSTLNFDFSKIEGGLQFKLTSEKIAFTHRAFQSEIKQKICKVIETIGGKIS